MNLDEINQKIISVNSAIEITLEIRKNAKDETEKQIANNVLSNLLFEKNVLIDKRIELSRFIIKWF